MCYRDGDDDDGVVMQCGDFFSFVHPFLRVDLFTILYVAALQHAHPLSALVFSTKAFL
jgi:hypothetical protein